MAAVGPSPWPTQELPRTAPGEPPVLGAASTGAGRQCGLRRGAGSARLPTCRSPADAEHAQYGRRAARRRGRTPSLPGFRGSRGASRIGAGPGAGRAQRAEFGAPRGGVRSLLQDPSHALPRPGHLFPTLRGLSGCLVPARRMPPAPTATFPGAASRRGWARRAGFQERPGEREAPSAAGLSEGQRVRPSP